MQLRLKDFKVWIHNNLINRINLRPCCTFKYKQSITWIVWHCKWINIKISLLIWRKKMQVITLAIHSFIHLFIYNLHAFIDWHLGFIRRSVLSQKSWENVNLIFPFATVGQNEQTRPNLYLYFKYTFPVWWT